VATVLLAEWALTTNYFDGAVLDGPVPRFFAADPTEARAALSADASKAYKDLQRIFSRLFITENIPASDAWSFVGNPRQFVRVQFGPVKPFTIPKKLLSQKGNTNKFQAKGLYLRIQERPLRDPDPGPRTNGKWKPTASIRTARQAPAHSGDRGHRGFLPPLPG
jgi:hypothetical protein